MAITETAGHRDPTEWHFVFYSTNGQYREVILCDMGEVIVRNHPHAPEY